MSCDEVDHFDSVTVMAQDQLEQSYVTLIVTMLSERLGLLAFGMSLQNRAHHSLHLRHCDTVVRVYQGQRSKMGKDWTL